MVAGQHVIAFTRQHAICPRATNHKIVPVTGVDDVIAADHRARAVSGRHILALKSCNHTGVSPRERTKVTGQPVDTAAARHLVCAGTAQRHIVVRRAEVTGKIIRLQGQSAQRGDRS